MIKLLIYSSVCRYLQSAQGDTPCLFPSLLELELIRQWFISEPISSEQGLVAHEQTTAKHRVRDIITVLCDILATRDGFGLCDGA